MLGVGRSHTVRFPRACSVGLCRRQVCSMAFGASCFIKHVTKAHLKRNRPSSWRRLTRHDFEKTITKIRRTSLRIRLFAGSCCESSFLSASVAESVAHVLQEPAFAAAAATVVSMVGQKRLRFATSPYTLMLLVPRIEFEKNIDLTQNQTERYYRVSILWSYLQFTEVQVVIRSFLE